MRPIYKVLGVGILLYGITCFITPYNKALRIRSIENQIDYLSDILDNGYDDYLQKRFPEGKMFSNALLGLSIIEYCDRYQIYEEQYAAITDRCVKRILSLEATRSFDSSIEPKYGMFYNGWALLILKTYLQSDLYMYSGIKTEVARQSGNFEERLKEAQQDSIKVLESYIGSNWPADNLIGLIALDDTSVRDQWLDVILKTTKNQDGLIHHAGGNHEKIRGSSSAMSTYCLSRMKSTLAEEYNKNYRKNFVDSFLGIDLVLEHTDRSNVMDVDSGPVIFGYGASATVMNIKTQASLELDNGKNSWALMNVIGLPINVSGQKFYLLQQEPMLDLFLLWGAVEL